MNLLSLILTVIVVIGSIVLVYFLSKHIYDYDEDDSLFDKLFMTFLAWVGLIGAFFLVSTFGFFLYNIINNLIYGG